MIIKKLFLITGLAALQSCATDYSCTEDNYSSGCKSVKAVYSKTGKKFHDTRLNEYNHKIADKQDFDQRELSIEVSSVAKKSVSTITGKPILTRPKIMRILFNHWEDSERDLNAGGYVYIRLTDSEWISIN